MLFIYTVFITKLLTLFLLRLFVNYEIGTYWYITLYDI